MTRSSFLRLACGAAAGCLATLYPLWAWYGIGRWGATPVILGLALVMAARLALSPSRQSALLAGVALTLAALSALLDSEEPALLYPVAVNALMLGVFGASLLSKRTVVERLARMRHPDLPPEGVRWCRGVTLAWCAFFVGNGLTALATVLSGDRNLWALWNGLVSYVLIGVMFAGELLLRTLVERRRARRA